MRFIMAINRQLQEGLTNPIKIKTHLRLVLRKPKVVFFKGKKKRNVVRILFHHFSRKLGQIIMEGAINKLVPLSQSK